MSAHEIRETGRRPRLSRGAIRFAFVGHGAGCDAEPDSADRLYLDVGNALRPGAVDHHHLPAFSGSTARLILAHPELVLDSVAEERDPSLPFTIVLHLDPDLDGLIASHLAIELLTTGALPEGSEPLARYADRVDAGHEGSSQEQPFTLYSAYMLLCHRLALRSWRQAEDRHRTSVEQGLEIVRYVSAQVAGGERSVFEVDAFATPGLFGPQDRADVRRDLERYHARLRDPATRARTARLRLPRQCGGSTVVDALFVRHVQDPDDPDRILFFKDWARTDRTLAPERDGFVALCVSMARGPTGRPRSIISVRPSDGVSLRGLGRALDEAEAARRRSVHGEDDRVVEPVTGRRLPPRAGYSNADPWYDGRAHGDTIVDSPRAGTALTADEIETIVRDYGGRSESEVMPLSLPVETPDEPTDDSATARTLTTIAQAWKSGLRDQFRSPDVFLSYPRARQEWVDSQVYRRLREHRPDLRIFFDQDSLRGGAGWLAQLAAAVQGCRVFLPVYCPEYFRSEYCQWELQLAIVRDPLGRRGILLPMMLEAVSLPSYCSLIQAEHVDRPDFLERLLDTLATVLPPGQNRDGRAGTPAQPG